MNLIILFLNIIFFNFNITTKENLQICREIIKTYSSLIKRYYKLDYETWKHFLQVLIGINDYLLNVKLKFTIQFFLFEQK